ncbi:MAG: hypothetical protein ABMB14_15685 [Myxococcota bacterium]
MPLALLLSCTREPAAPTDATSDPGSEPVDSTVPSTGPFDLYDDPPYDCAAGVPPGPFAPTTLSRVVTTEDLAFDLDGWLVASDLAGNLLRYDAAGNLAVWVPNLANTRGIDLLPDGAVVLSNETLAQLTRIDPASAAATSIAPTGASPAGIDVAADGTVYVGDLASGGVFEVTPAGDVTALWPPSSTFVQAYGVALSVDEQTLYAAPFNDRALYRLVRDPAGGWRAPDRWVKLPQHLLTGVAVDACDQLYVLGADCHVYRIDPATEGVETLTELPVPGQFCANLAFGRAVGGWDPYSLYVTTYDDVVRLEIGVPGRPR